MAGHSIKILGIDPGSSRTGWGLIEKQGGNLKLLDAGIIEIKTKNPNEKLFYLTRDFQKLLQKTKPKVVAVEKLFFTKNIKTGIEVAQTRGAIILEVTKYKIPIVELSPSEVKLAVTGYGLSDKKGVAKMVAKILNTEKLVGFDDASDALAIAIAATNKGIDSQLF